MHGAKWDSELFRDLRRGQPFDLEHHEYHTLLEPHAAKDGFEPPTRVELERREFGIGGRWLRCSGFGSQLFIAPIGSASLRGCHTQADPEQPCRELARAIEALQAPMDHQEDLLKRVRQVGFGHTQSM